MNRWWLALTLTERQVRALGTALIGLGMLVLPGAWLWAAMAAWAEPVVVRPELVELPGGTFTMGSPGGDAGRSDDERQHEVTLSPFLMSKTEVTQGMYRAVMGALPTTCDVGGLQAGDDLPVHCVTWDEAAAFCEALSALEGLPAGQGYRLPTEAEWEYAARAGTDLVYAGTSEVAEVCAFGNVADATAKAANPGWTTFDCDDGYAELAPVAFFRPNAWGLHDLTGNVWEWTADWYDEDYGGDAVDPRGPPSGSVRVIRGGSFGYGPAGSSPPGGTTAWAFVSRGRCPRPSLPLSL